MEQDIPLARQITHAHRANAEKRKPQCGNMPENASRRHAKVEMDLDDIKNQRKHACAPTAAQTVSLPIPTDNKEAAQRPTPEEREKMTENAIRGTGSLEHLPTEPQAQWGDQVQK